MDPQLSAKVLALVGALKQLGFQPRIFFGWRSVAVQLQLYNQGNTTVKFSFHNAQKPDGTPNAYAADIIDSRYSWNPEAETSGFWKALGEEAKKQGLYWGGDWVSFRDWAHVQLFPNSHLAQVKRESGL
jgi:D-alanyl-D-alanine carboxypeptidase